MKTNFKILPYSKGSESARSLSEALGALRVRHIGKPIHIKFALNWGLSRKPERHITVDRWLNEPLAIENCSNKLKTFEILDGAVDIPDWTTDKEVARKWLKKNDVVCRTILNGHSGKGIIIVPKNEEDLPDAPLYTKYIPKDREIRLHVFRDEVFFIQEKKRKKDVPDDKVNWKIRNHQNGFIYAIQNIEVSEEMKQDAITAITLLGLDFGAVDMIYNKRRDKHYVLEVNSAPGLQSPTLINSYKNIFKNLR